jgi:hypothetical protein
MAILIVYDRLKAQMWSLSTRVVLLAPRPQVSYLWVWCQEGLP